MLRLHQTFGAHAGRVREIDQDVVRFGRLPTNDFAFDAHADLDASGNHAEIRREGGRWVLVDVGSRNGTLVNGRPVQRSVLDGGEEIEFGTGGPRVRIEIIQGGRGMPTAPATPISPDPYAMPVSPQGPTALAPAGLSPMGSVRPIPPSAPPPPYQPGLPPSAVPTPLWPAAGKPPFAPPPPTPAPSAPPGLGLSPVPSGSGSPKLYGQRTVEQMIQSAVSQAVVSQPGSPGAFGGQVGSSPGTPSGSAHDTAFIRQVAEDAAGQRSRGMMFVLGIVLALFFLTLCGVSGIIAMLWAQAA